MKIAPSINSGCKLEITNAIPPRHSLGQNFLVDRNILRKIISVANLNTGSQVLEVGPGKGVMTRELLKVAGVVVAVEKDRRLFEYLQSACQSSRLPEAAPRSDTLQLVNQDILRVTETDLQDFFHNKPYCIVANLPYNITSEFLRKFLECEYQPEKMILMVQKEVAERIVERDGKTSLLSLSVKFFCEPKILFPVSRGCFRPSPRVDSAIIELANIRRDKYGVAPEDFFRVIRAGFSHKRKLLKSNLSEGLELGGERVEQVLTDMKLKLTVRAEELGMDEWVGLVTAFFPNPIFPR